MKYLEFIQRIRFLYAKRYPLYAIISTNSYVRIYKQIMQNKPNFPHFSPKNDVFTKNKANSNPICRKGKNERFCVDKEPYYCFNNATRGFYHPKGCPEV